MDAQKPLDGKVALITGASRGIGLAVAASLAGMGARLSVCARAPKRLEQAASELRRGGADVLAVPADVRNASEIAELVRRTEESLGPVEILINNAGIGYFAPIQEASEANWDAVLDTNLKAVFLLTKAVAPGMIARRGGHIVNIA
jgi:NADP-dependent 3-hydroxy acid dehydrogenase YdfG